MNDILAKIEWERWPWTVSLPPAAFMEFQAYKVLVIACDMRQIHHIEYTPRAGHCARGRGSCAHYCRPRILKLFAASLAKSSESNVRPGKDSSCIKRSAFIDLKERPNADPKEVDEATKLVEHRQKNLGTPSEWPCFAFALVDR